MEIEESRPKKSIGDWINDTLQAWSTVFNRFPFFLLGVFIFCAYLSYMVEIDFLYREKVIFPIVISLLGIFTTYLLSENYTISSIVKLIGFLLSVALGVLFYYLLPENAYSYQDIWVGISFSIFILIFHLLYSVIPFLNKKNDDDGFLRYNIKVLENFLESLLLSLILFLFLCLAIYSIKILFDISLFDNLFFHLGTWIFLFLHTINFLSTYPSRPYSKENLGTYNGRFYRIVVLYIGIPVVCVYAIITIAYIFKMFNGDYKEWIVSLCTWYFIVGIFVYLLNKLYLRDNQNSIASTFNRYFPIASLPILLLFFYSAYKKILDEGINIDSYYLALACVASLVLLGIFLLKDKIELKYISFTLIAFAFFSVFSGPLNSWKLSETSQKKNLIEMLSESGYLKNNKFDFARKDEVKNANKIEQCIYKLDSYNQLSFLKEYDSKKELRDTITSSELLEKLSMPRSYSDKLSFLNKYFEQTVVDIKGAQELYPILNKYVDLTPQFTGIKIGISGSLVLYKNGQIQDSTYMPLANFESQKSTLSFPQSQDSFQLIIYNATYKTHQNNTGSIEDLTGMVVRR